LTVAQVACVVVICTGAVLLVSSFARIRSHDVGFDVGEVVSAEVIFRGSQYSGYETLEPMFGGIAERLRESGFRDNTVWGFASVQRLDKLPSFTLDGGEERDTKGGIFKRPFPFVSVDGTPELFETLGLTLVAGRRFTSRDVANSEQVVIVNRMVAESFWPGADPIGRRFKLGPAAAEVPWLRVVGLAENSGVPASVGLGLGLTHGRTDFPLMYRPAAQTRLRNAVSPYSTARRLTFGVRADVNQQQDAIQALDRALREAFPDQPIERPTVFRELMLENDRVASVSAIAGVLVALTFIGAVLAMVGVASVAFEGVVRRTKEIGVSPRP
jgi:hypothetical protein